MNGWITQLRKGLLDFCILNVLKHGESYGYEIVQELKKIEELSVFFPDRSRQTPCGGNECLLGAAW